MPSRRRLATWVQESAEMKKTKKIVKKLRLNNETVRALSQEETRLVAGGATLVISDVPPKCGTFYCDP